MDETQREKLEVLHGDRPKGRERAAVRLEDLGRLLQMAASLQSAAAAGPTPTKAEFDALRKDVIMLHNCLRGIAETIQRRVL